MRRMRGSLNDRCHSARARVTGCWRRSGWCARWTLGRGEKERTAATWQEQVEDGSCRLCRLCGPVKRRQCEKMQRLHLHNMKLRGMFPRRTTRRKPHRIFATHRLALGAVTMKCLGLSIPVLALVLLVSQS